MLMQRYTTKRPERRRGTIIPTLAICMVALLGMIALAIDLGMVAVARTQAQNAVDIASLAGVRTLDGDPSAQYNISTSVANAKSAASNNKIFLTPISPSKVSVRTGIYKYDPTLQRFNAPAGSYTNSSTAAPPGGSGGTWTATETTLNTTSQTYFARVFGINTFNVYAKAVAVHRPRDIALVLDYSGSMMFSSESHWPSSGDVSGGLNPDPAWPKFGHWSRHKGLATTGANPMQRTEEYVDSGGETHAPNNHTVTTTAGPPMVEAFYYRDAGNALQLAFKSTTPDSSYNPLALPTATPAPQDWDEQLSTTATYVGDQAPRINQATSGLNWAKTVDEYLGTNNTSNTHAKNVAFETAGYGPNFKGYSMGPGYYGKTFWQWPPDPRTPVGQSGTTNVVPGDWRKRFFFYGSSAVNSKGNNISGQRLDNNAVLFDSTGNIRQPSSSGYQVDYAEILRWIKSGPQTLPPNLRAGRVLYYDAIPNTIAASPTNLNEVFWKRYIDTVLGIRTSNGWKREFFGRDSSGWGTIKITSKYNLLNLGDQTQNAPYMQYKDNPIRPRAHFWFGPLTMIMMLSDSNETTSPFIGNMMAGTLPEAQTWQLKAGINSALEDVKKNHPNDWLSLIAFSDKSEYATPRVAMGQDYTKMKNALFYPLSMVNAGTLSNGSTEVRPYNASWGYTQDGNIPNARGGTCPEMGFKLAYNQFSSASGFNGRRGATRMVILETDGVPNAYCGGTFNSAGAYNSSWTGSIGTTTFVANGDSGVLTKTMTAVNRIMALDTASQPGYSTARNGAKVHVIAFGDLFESNSTYKPTALQFLANVQVAGGTSPSGATSIEPYKIIVGDYTTRIDNLRTALERIMQSGVQVSLIE